MCVSPPVLQRSEAAATDDRTQRARSIQPSAVAVRSSMSAHLPSGGPGGGAHPGAQVPQSPFAGAAVAPTALSPFADQAPGPAPTSVAAPAAGAVPLVSPFSSGALPAGLDFDVRQHANAVAAAAAAAASAASRQQGGGAGKHSSGGGSGV